MIHNSININTTNNHLSFQTNEHKKTTTFSVGNSGFGTGKKCGRFNPATVIQTLPVW